DQALLCRGTPALVAHWRECRPNQLSLRWLCQSRLPPDFATIEPPETKFRARFRSWCPTAVRRSRLSGQGMPLLGANPAASKLCQEVRRLSLDRAGAFALPAWQTRPIGAFAGALLMKIVRRRSVEDETRTLPAKLPGQSNRQRDRRSGSSCRGVGLRFRLDPGPHRGSGGIRSPGTTQAVRLHEGIS